MGLFSKLFGKSNFGTASQANSKTDETNTVISNNSPEKIKVDTNNKVVNSIVNDTESESETKIIAIHSIVVGLKYEGRQAKLKKLINQLKKDDYFYEKYDGLTNKEIKDDYSYTDEDDPIWELTNEYLPYSTIKSEPTNPYDSNAIAVYIGENEDESFQVGYLPSEDAARIQDLIKKATLIDVDAKIRGGKYKYFDFDDFGDEKVMTGNKDYSLSLTIDFEK